jgi:hypothetical protein
LRLYGDGFERFGQGLKARLQNIGHGGNYVSKAIILTAHHGAMLTTSPQR